MLLFYLKFQNRLHPPQVQTGGFLFLKNTHFERLETENFNPIVQKSVFLKNRVGESWRIIVKNKNSEINH